MFCINCGTSLPGTARFCSSCGTSVASPSPAQERPPIHSPSSQGSTPHFSPIQGSPPIYSPVDGPSPRPTNTSLLSPQGYPQAAFERLAAALFNALDQAFQVGLAIPFNHSYRTVKLIGAHGQPQRTGGLEVSKLKAYRTLGGLTVPPYYGEYVLPTYASVVGIDLVPNQPQTAPVISWTGWHQFLLHKILLEPEATFLHLTRLLVALSVPLVLNRADFPLFPSPQAQAKEGQFKTAIYALAQRGLGAGALGAGLGGGLGGFGMGGGLGMGMGGGGTAGSTSTSSVAAQAMAKLAVQGGMNIMNASMGGGGMWYMPPS